MIVWDNGTKKREFMRYGKIIFMTQYLMRTFILMKYMEKMKFC